MTTNIFSKISNFDDLTTDPAVINIFLTIAKHHRRTYDELTKDTGLGFKEVVNLIDKLEKSNFIEGNPGPMSKKFKLSFNGQLFAEQLKSRYPEVEEYLGRESLIEPLEVVA